MARREALPVLTDAPACLRSGSHAWPHGGARRRYFCGGAVPLALSVVSLASLHCGTASHAPRGVDALAADADNATAADSSLFSPIDASVLEEGGPVPDALGEAGNEASADIGSNPNPAMWRNLPIKAEPVDNPLKGFVPYRGSYAFPHSMEWFYLPLSSVMTGPSAFSFDTGLEPLLKDVAARGHQAVFRVYLDYPSKPSGVPQFLLDGGLQTHSYTDYGGGQSPDYENPKLVDALEKFVAALGSQYDGDPRVGFVQEGLLGFWGEWHTYPHDAWFASVATQNRVLHAFARAFTRTKVQVRHPAADSATLPVGYHDDSFAYETLPPTAWHFWPTVVAAGQADVWKTQAIGGELRPEIQSSVFDVPPVSPDDYGLCVTTTHATWLLNQAAFDPSFTGAKLDRAIAGAGKLGYQLAVTASKLSIPHDGSPVQLDVKIANNGVAPFYYDWPVDVALLEGNSISHLWHPDWKLSTILPGSDVTLSTREAVPGIGAGPYSVGIRVVNPLSQGKPLQFANADQESVWLRLIP